MWFKDGFWCYANGERALIPEGNAVIKNTQLTIGTIVILVNNSIIQGSMRCIPS